MDDDGERPDSGDQGESMESPAPAGADEPSEAATGADEPTEAPAEADEPSEAVEPDLPPSAAPKPVPPRHGRMPRHGGWISGAKLAAAVVAVIAVSGVAVAAFAAADLVTTVASKPTLTLANESVLDGVPDIGAMEGGLNFLLVGSDKRPPDGAFGDPEEDSAVLNDVTMLVHISQDHSHVEVVSFPRDMLVAVPECPDPADPAGEPLSSLSSVKINTVLSYGGFGCVASTVEQLTGVTVPVGGIVEFYGVAALAEAVGGVEVCVAEAIADERTDIYLEPGMHTLTGMAALQFLRTRHGVGDGSDLGRISNQQVFLSALMRTVQSSGTLNDPVKLYGIAKAALSNMNLSSRLQNPTALISIARAVQDIDLSKIAFVQYPTVYTEDSTAVEPSESAAALNAALQADLPFAIDPNATTQSEFGTAPDPTIAPVEPVEPGDESEPTVPEDPAATDAAADPATPAEPAAPLPPDVTGQTAAEVRCSSANEG
ncbi:LCP family protein [Agromyces salentinus]|uniref:Cell envelope-related transcriptional attenuator domain-containing protein n=1 Tax=Agromyces salentinus TaxID=269421 RepID=A0ABN2MUF3_9MICO|nr:LCP family protein [Agromyces salentinus]